MPRYSIDVEVTVIYNVQLEAENIQEAEDDAMDGVVNYNMGEIVEVDERSVDIRRSKELK